MAHLGIHTDMDFTMDTLLVGFLQGRLVLPKHGTGGLFMVKESFHATH